MQKKLYTVFLLVTLIFPLSRALATQQSPEYISYAGSWYVLKKTPLESFFEKSDARPRPEFCLAPGIVNSANWRGYIGVWEIDSNKLYLKCLHSYIHGKPVEMGELLGENTSGGRFHAKWFTGDFTIVRDTRRVKVSVKNGTVKDIVHLTKSSESWEAHLWVPKSWENLKENLRSRTADIYPRGNFIVGERVTLRPGKPALPTSCTR